MRVAIKLAYDGSRYQGFQIQNTTKNTVAYELYEVFKSLHIPATLHSSGRTDKGVHATGQIIHIDLPPFWTDCEKLHMQMQLKLPHSIKIRSIKEVSSEFHARYSAKKRTYRYLLSTKDADPFKASYLTFTQNFDLDQVQAALKAFIGVHDFKFFQKVGGGNNTTVREIYEAKIYPYKDLFVIHLSANGFLRSQVRMMVEAALRVGRDKLTMSQLHDQISATRQHLTRLAPAGGLYLSSIRY